MNKFRIYYFGKRTVNKKIKKKVVEQNNQVGLGACSVKNSTSILCEKFFVREELFKEKFIFYIYNIFLKPKKKKNGFFFFFDLGCWENKLYIRRRFFFMWPNV